MPRRGSIISGAVLIIVGILLLALQLVPEELVNQLDISRSWPLILVVVGGLLLVGAFFGAPPLAQPASILGGLGLLMYYQNLSGNWDSWAYAWTLIIGFVGIGILLSNVIEGRLRTGLRAGGRLIFISLFLFIVFGAFLGNWISSGLLWPSLLILLGCWMLIRNLTRGVRR